MYTPYVHRGPPPTVPLYPVAHVAVQSVPWGTSEDPPPHSATTYVACVYAVWHPHGAQPVNGPPVHAPMLHVTTPPTGVGVPLETAVQYPLPHVAWHSYRCGEPAPQGAT